MNMEKPISAYAHLGKRRKLKRLREDAKLKKGSRVLFRQKHPIAKNQKRGRL